MPFRDLQGQARAVSYLLSSWQRSRLAHAFLFTGPEGVGKRTAAKALAQVLNCLSPQAQDACGICSACRKIEAGIHPDVRLVEAEGAHLKIEQIRECIQADVMLKPMEGRHKVYILDPADTLTPGAANSLLKILEEPPPAVAIILITTQPFALLETIRSRCQEVRFFSLAASSLAAWLQTHAGCEAKIAQTAAMLSGGRPAEALRVLSPDRQELRQEVLELAQAAGSKDWADWAQTAGERLSDWPEVLTLMLTWYRDLLFLALGAPQELIMNVDRQAELAAASCGETPDSLSAKCRAVLSAGDQLNRNANAQLLLEVLGMNLGRPAASGH